MLWYTYDSHMYLYNLRLKTLLCGERSIVYFIRKKQFK